MKQAELFVEALKQGLSRLKRSGAFRSTNNPMYGRFPSKFFASPCGMGGSSSPFQPAGAISGPMRISSWQRTIRSGGGDVWPCVRIGFSSRDGAPVFSFSK
jgi:hypothetical protein